MRRYYLILVVTLAAGCDDSPTEPSGPSMSFFVTSATSVTGNLGGLAGADATCQRLAVAAGQGSRTWRAYLSVERDPANGNQPTNARDRIGTGPWHNASLALVANNVTELHARTGDAALFLDERGQRINGQWTGSPTPNQHDVLTGSRPDGTLLPGIDVLGLDVRFGWREGTGGTLGRDGSQPEHRTPAVIVELGARQPELRRHGASRRGGAVLLLRAVGAHAGSFTIE